jgi:cell division septum initiation protein DivIVA
MRSQKNEARRHPALGRQLFGYSRSQTNSLLEHSAKMIEQLEAVAAACHQDLEAAQQALEAVKDENERARNVFAAMKAEIQRLKDEAARQPAPVSAPEIDPAIGEALVTAHRTATEIVARAQEAAEEIERDARRTVSTAEAEAHALIERAAAARDQMKHDRAAWVEFLRRALESADHVGTEPERQLILTEVAAADSATA